MRVPASLKVPLFVAVLWMGLYLWMSLFDAHIDGALKDKLNAKGFGCSILGFTYTKRRRRAQERRQRKVSWLTHLSIPFGTLLVISSVFVLVLSAYAAAKASIGLESIGIITLAPIISRYDGVVPFISVIIVGFMHELGHAISASLGGREITGYGMSLKYGCLGFFVMSDTYRDPSEVSSLIKVEPDTQISHPPTQTSTQTQNSDNQDEGEGASGAETESPSKQEGLSRDKENSEKRQKIIEQKQELMRKKEKKTLSLYSRSFATFVTGGAMCNIIIVPIVIGIAWVLVGFSPIYIPDNTKYKKFHLPLVNLLVSRGTGLTLVDISDSCYRNKGKYDAPTEKMKGGSTCFVPSDITPGAVINSFFGRPVGNSSDLGKLLYGNSYGQPIDHTTSSLDVASRDGSQDAFGSAYSYLKDIPQIIEDDELYSLSNLVIDSKKNAPAVKPIKVSLGLRQSMPAGGICLKNTKIIDARSPELGTRADTLVSYVPVAYEFSSTKGTATVTALRKVFVSNNVWNEMYDLGPESICSPSANCTDTIPCVLPPSFMVTNNDDIEGTNSASIPVAFPVKFREGRANTKRLISMPLDQITHNLQMQEWVPHEFIHNRRIRVFVSMLQHHVTTLAEAISLVSLGMVVANWAPLGSKGDGAMFFTIIDYILKDGGHVVLGFLWYGVRLLAYAAVAVLVATGGVGMIKGIVA